MTFVVIAASAAATLATDHPVIAADDVVTVGDAAAAVARAGQVLRSIDDMAAAATATARTEGHAQGYAEGLSVAAGETRAALLAQSVALNIERRRIRADVTRLALEVVRRIAGDLGEAATVAALAERATADFLPDNIAIVRVSADAVATVTDRLRDFTGLTIVGDSSVAANDCLIETALGVSHAGLEIQLAAVERAWAAAGEGSDHG